MSPNLDRLNSAYDRYRRALDDAYSVPDTASLCSSGIALLDDMPEIDEDQLVRLVVTEALPERWETAFGRWQFDLGRLEAASDYDEEAMDDLGPRVSVDWRLAVLAYRREFVVSDAEAEAALSALLKDVTEA